MQEGDENWHEVGDGLCRQNDIIGFEIARAQRTKLLVKRAQQGALQAYLLHANFHRPPALLMTTFRLKRDKLIRYPSHPF